MFITEVLDEMDARHLNKAAVVCGDDSITFHQLREQTCNLASHMAALGIVSGDTVGILLPNCVEYAACFIAPLRVGAISVPLNPRYDQPELRAIFEDCGLSALITTPDQTRIVECLLEKQRNFKALIVNKIRPQNAPLADPEFSEYLRLENMLDTKAGSINRFPIDAEDDAAYMYTSGTTGLPKGVVLTHGIIARRGANDRNLDITASDRCYTTGGLYHNGKLFIGLVWSLYLGMTFYTDPEFHPQQTLDRLFSDKISFFHASPFHFGILANWEGFREIPELPHLRLCLCSGNKASESVAQKFRERFGIGITQNYGITEAGGLCTDGFPHRGVKIKILGKAGEELGRNEIGDVIVTGPGKAKGYLNRPELNSKAFKGDWFYTGDLGKIDEEGRLHILCRIKNVIIIDGKEIYPDAIEEVLCSHPNVQNALIRKGEGESLRAFIVLNGPCSEQDIIEFCQGHVKAHEVPQAFQFCEKLPHRWQNAIDQENFDLVF